MKFPESWLREQVQVEAGHEALSACLTAIGLEVEADTAIGGELPGVRVAQIVAMEKHPDAERLNVCQVDAGEADTLQIVCGAPNARVGLKAPLACIGAVLPGGLRIQATRLRGVESHGMLCSAKELGIDADASGLLELPADAPVGTALADYLGLPDHQFELKLTPNRADCFSVRGIAFDVAAALGTRVNALEIPEAAVQTTATMAVELAAGPDCPRFCGRIVEGLDPAATSPLWLSERLKRAGLRPINPLVDITNYVMLELGQPLHAFDADRLQGPLIVRHARPGETLKLLDEREVTLDPGFLLVTDADRPVALGGIMGGWDTRVSETTTRVFFEAAHWIPGAIIGRARKLGMHTDASHRFERGVDPELPRYAVERATALALQILGGRAGPMTEASLPEYLAPPVPVALRRAHIARVLGLPVADERVEQILRALGMQVTATAEGWRVTAPSRRFDIALEEDLIEELARIIGYDQIPVRLPGGAAPLVAPSEQAVDEAAARAQLLAMDLQDTINYAFVDAGLLQAWQLQDNAVALANPLSAELAVMRPSLLPGLVSTLTANAARQQTRLRLFEIGRVFAQANDGGPPVERQSLAGVLCGSAEAEQWNQPVRALDFHDARAVLDAVLARLGFQAEYAPADAPYLHPGRSATVSVAGIRIGRVGALHPALNKALDLPGDVYAFEIDLSALPVRALPKAEPVSRFPSVRRDLALIVPESVAYARIDAAIRRALGERLHELRVFDVYRGPGLQPGTKSIAIGLILHEFSRTLSEAEIDQSVSGALHALAEDCQAVLRT